MYQTSGHFWFNDFRPQTSITLLTKIYLLRMVNATTLTPFTNGVFCSRTAWARFPGRRWPRSCSLRGPASRRTWTAWLTAASTSCLPTSNQASNRFTLPSTHTHNTRLLLSVGFLVIAWLTAASTSCPPTSSQASNRFTLSPHTHITHITHVCYSQ